jgi:hypothetical protein
MLGVSGSLSTIPGANRGVIHRLGCSARLRPMLGRMEPSPDLFELGDHRFHLRRYQLVRLNQARSAILHP